MRCSASRKDATSRKTTGAGFRLTIISSRKARWRRLFADLPEAIENTVEIARRCAFRPGPAQADPAELRARRGRRRRRRSRRAEGAGRSGARAPPCRDPGASPRGERGGLQEAPRLRARRHHPHEVSGLLPDRVRLHQMDEGARHSRGAGPRLGRWLGRGLVADHHRSRSDPLRPSLRALPQSRARLDAGLRHRLLPGPARRSDRLCPREIRRGPGCADHHLRKAASARRAARCRAAFCKCPMGRWTGSARWCRTIRRTR